MFTIADYVPEITTYLWRRQNRADPVTTKAPISLRVEIPGFPRAEISTGVKATPEEWDQDHQELQPVRGMSKTERAYQKEQMDRITDLRRKVERMYHAYKGQGANPSPKQLRELVRGYKPKAPAPETSFAGVLETYRLDVAKPARGASPGTIENNVKHTLWLLLYMHHTDQLQTQAADVTRVWMRGFERWAEGRGLGGKSLRSIIGVARSALEMAEGEGVIKENRLVGYKYLSKLVKPKKLRLSEDAVAVLAAHAFPKRLQKIADMFLFMCYTGLSHVDYTRFAREPERFLKHKNHPVTGEPILGIDMARQKMQADQDEFWAPLLPKARALLIDKYKYCLPAYGRSHANERLKQVATEAGINASFLSNKIARATFSQMMRDEYGGEISAAMARHDLNTANKHYSTVSPKRIMSVLGLDLTDN